MTKELQESQSERDVIFSRWRRLCRGQRTLSNLIGFHSRHKYQILAHDPEIYRDLGRLVARGKELPIDELFPQYRQLLVRAMDSPITPGKHFNVLQHMAGYFKRHLAEDEKTSLHDVLEAYRNEEVSLSEPLLLIRWLAERYDLSYLVRQTYLSNTFSS